MANNKQLIQSTEKPKLNHTCSESNSTKRASDNQSAKKSAHEIALEIVRLRRNAFNKK